MRVHLGSESDGGELSTELDQRARHRPLQDLGILPKLLLVIIAVVMIGMFGYSRHLGQSQADSVEQAVLGMRHAHGELVEQMAAFSLGRVNPAQFADEPLSELMTYLQMIKEVIEGDPSAPKSLAPHVSSMIAEGDALKENLRLMGPDLKRLTDSISLLTEASHEAYFITEGLTDTFQGLAIDLFVSDLLMVQNVEEASAVSRARLRHQALSRYLSQGSFADRDFTQRILESSATIIEISPDFTALMNDLYTLTIHERVDVIEEGLERWSTQIGLNLQRTTDSALLLGFALLGAAAYYMRRMSHIAGYLREVNDTLESRVDERTAELTASNKSLRREVADRREAERRLSRMAMTDPLTGLGNRSLIRHRLEVEIAELKGKPILLGLFLVDLDHFKSINEGYGHETGDELLREMGQRLGCLFDGRDTIVRLGDDEFAILVTSMMDIEHINQTALRIRDAVAEPSFGTFGQIGLRASIGVSVAPLHSEEPESLLRMAGVALEAAKQSGRGNYQVYEPTMDANSRDRRALEDDLSAAITNNELTLFYQPQIDISTGLLCGAEALVRWQHPERGMVSPGEFIPIAEDNGQIIDIGRWALWTAAEQRLAWERDNVPDFRVAVNVSPRQVQLPGFVETVANMLETTGLNPRLLELEVTENLVISQSDDVPDVLHELYCLGVELAIDDFGTGYSSLNYLKRFSVHRLKIDRSFIADARNEPEDRAIVRTVIRLGQTLGLRVLAEGVEDKETLDFLAAEGCDEVQGFYYAKPMPADEFAQWVENYQSSDVRSVA